MFTDPKLIAIEKLYYKDPLMARIRATEEMLKRYLDVPVDFDMAVDCMVAIMSPTATKYQKAAARVVLNKFFGVVETNNMINDVAVVYDRNDALVRRWKEAVFKRDDYKCRNCGSNEKIAAHHISYWSNDPINRVNIKNGITLCSKCHAQEHEADNFYGLVASRI